MPRIFSGATPAEMDAAEAEIADLKVLWVPVTLASDLTLIGDHPAALINAAAEYAAIEMLVPVTFVSLERLDLWCIGAANIGAMKIDVAYDFGGTNEAYNVHSGTLNATVTTILNSIFRIALTAETVLANNLAAGDHLGIRPVYNIGPTATNVYILGAELRWL